MDSGEAVGGAGHGRMSCVGSMLLRGTMDSQSWMQRVITGLGPRWEMFKGCDQFTGWDPDRGCLAGFSEK